MENPVVCVCKDAGGTNGIVPVHQALLAAGVPSILIANGKALELLPSRGVGFRYYPTPDAILADIPAPAALVTSICTGGGIGRDLVPLLKGRRPTIALQDFWLSPFRANGSWRDPQYRPDAFVVNDEFGAMCVRPDWEEGTREGRIHVIGYPSLDALASFDGASAAQGVNAMLSVAPDEPVVLYIGGVQRTAAILSQVIAACELAQSRGRRFTFIPRSHPAMRDLVPEEAKLWDAALRSSRITRVVSDSQSVADTTALVARASAVISTHSTVLMIAAALRKPTISFLDAEEREIYRRATSGVFERLPLVTLGCAVEATSVDDLAALIERCVDGHGLGPEERQAATFTLDGKNAERVAAFVRSLVQ